MYGILKEPLEIRLGKAKNKKTEPMILNELSRDSFWFVRNFIAANPSTPVDTLTYLLCDEDFRVQFEANKNLKNRNLDNIISAAENKKNNSRNNYRGSELIEREM